MIDVEGKKSACQRWTRRLILGWARGHHESCRADGIIHEVRFLALPRRAGG
jgi:hypothetical protein